MRKLFYFSDENASNVCVINGITGTEAMEVVDYDAELIGNVSGYNTLDCGIIGSIVNGKYTKAIDVYPSTDVEIRVIDNNLFCGMLAGSTNSAFKLGAFSNYNYGAFLDGNKFFARHSCIVGNSGSSKSFTVATMLEILNCLAGANEQQATLLITFLKNTPVVVAFKVELVRQFFAMREEHTPQRLSFSLLNARSINLTRSKTALLFLIPRVASAALRVITGMSNIYGESSGLL